MQASKVYDLLPKRKLSKAYITTPPNAHTH